MPVFLLPAPPGALRCATVSRLCAEHYECRFYEFVPRPLARNTEPIDPANAPVTVTLVTTPLFHVTANNCVVQPATLTGGKIIHMYKWDAGEALKLIDGKITGISGVPVMSREIIGHPDFDDDTSSLTALGGGGAQLHPDLVGKIDKALKMATATGYGMTETCIISAVSNDFSSTGLKVSARPCRRWTPNALTQTAMTCRTANLAIMR